MQDACPTHAPEEGRGTDERWRAEYQLMPRWKFPSSQEDIGLYKNFWIITIIKIQEHLDISYLFQKFLFLDISITVQKHGNVGQ